MSRKPRFTWTPARMEALADLVAEGLSDARIATIMGAGVESVRTNRQKLGVERVNMAIWWTPEKDAELRCLHADGASDDEAADAMGVSARSIRRRRYHLELFNTNGPRPVIDAPPALHLSRDASFVDRLLRDGGVPRAVATPKGPVWLGADDRPWIDPDKRRVAA